MATRKGVDSDIVRLTSIRLGMSTGAAIMTFFGFVWFGWGLGSLDSMPWEGWIALYVCGLSLLFLSVRAIRGARKQLVSLSGSVPRMENGKQFGLVSAAEFVGCGIAVAICYAQHRIDLLAPAIGIVVGLHFIPLARVFNFAGYYAIGASIVAVSVCAMILFSGDAVAAATGTAIGAILWLTAVYALVAPRFLTQRSVSYPA